MIKKNKKFFHQDYQKKKGNVPSISLASTKMLKRLSFSFYGEDIIKQQKQIILDTYDETICEPKTAKLKRNPSYDSKSQNMPLIKRRKVEKKKKSEDDYIEKMFLKKKRLRNDSKSVKNRNNCEDKNKILKVLKKVTDVSRRNWKSINNMFKVKQKNTWFYIFHTFKGSRGLRHGR